MSHKELLTSLLIEEESLDSNSAFIVKHGDNHANAFLLEIGGEVRIYTALHNVSGFEHLIAPLEIINSRGETIWSRDIEFAGFSNRDIAWSINPIQYNLIKDFDLNVYNHFRVPPKIGESHSVIGFHNRNPYKTTLDYWGITRKGKACFRVREGCVLQCGTSGSVILNERSEAVAVFNYSEMEDVDGKVILVSGDWIPKMNHPFVPDYMKKVA